MKSNAMLAATLITLFGTAVLLSACQTTAGAGRDMSAGGQAITKSAVKNAP